jgi:kinesin family member 5
LVILIFNIGKCIHALTDSKTNFVPFRDSKLTRILQDSLGGNSKTSLVVTIGPSIKNIEETLSSLYFGSRAMKVQNKPIINRQKDYYVLFIFFF